MPHHCVAEFENDVVSLDGVAIEQCLEDEEGKFQVNNREYGNPVNFCPFCGTKAPTSSLVLAKVTGGTSWRNK